ncbi:hypothetical protein BJ912DRAFT_925099 [Pholiota molesta]|nr:hypothetical protein BJ912DRAFT_925099 [Pholiota molesta]
MLGYSPKRPPRARPHPQRPTHPATPFGTHGTYPPSPAHPAINWCKALGLCPLDDAAAAYTAGKRAEIPSVGAAAAWTSGDVPDTLAHELHMDRREGWLDTTDSAVAAKDDGYRMCVGGCERDRRLEQQQQQQPVMPEVCIRALEGTSEREGGDQGRERAVILLQEECDPIQGNSSVQVPKYPVITQPHRHELLPTNKRRTATLTWLNWSDQYPEGADLKGQGEMLG